MDLALKELKGWGCRRHCAAGRARRQQQVCRLIMMRASGSSWHGCLGDRLRGLQAVAAALASDGGPPRLEAGRGRPAAGRGGGRAMISLWALKVEVQGIVPIFNRWPCLAVAQHGAGTPSACHNGISPSGPTWGSSCPPPCCRQSCSQSCRQSCR